MRTIVILSGAGLSAESGIPTFRDSNGLWENHKVEDVASPEGWERDKELVLNFYKERYNSVQNCEPNEAHKSIARLQEKFEVINVTQNIDDLLERAGCTDVRHIHGKIHSIRCEWHTDGGEGIEYACDFRAEGEPPSLGDTCLHCGGQLRPDVVWFGEAVDMPNIKKMAKKVKYANGVFISIGTSAQVAPAAFMIPMFSQVRNKYIIDKSPFRVGDYVLLEGNATEKMKELADELLAEES